MVVEFKHRDSDPDRRRSDRAHRVAGDCDQNLRKVGVDSPVARFVASANVERAILPGNPIVVELAADGTRQASMSRKTLHGKSN